MHEIHVYNIKLLQHISMKPHWWIDDMFIHDMNGGGHRERNRALIAVLEVARENNITFKLKKSQIGMSEVDFSGHIMSTQCLKEAKDKVRAIQEMPSPRSQEEL